MLVRAHGQGISNCGRTFFVSYEKVGAVPRAVHCWLTLNFWFKKTQKNFESALDSCFNRNMELVSLRNSSKFNNCIASMNTFNNNVANSLNNETSGMKILDSWFLEIFWSCTDYWTSGVRTTTDNYVWCSEKLGADLSSKKRKKRQIPAVSTQCVKVNDSGSLESVNCWQTHRFICEVIQIPNFKLELLNKPFWDFKVNINIFYLRVQNFLIYFMVIVC